MKKNSFYILAIALGFIACNDVEKVNPTIAEDDISSIASIAQPQDEYHTLYTLTEVEATLLPFGIEEIPVPVGYVPILNNYNQINCYIDPTTLNYYYVYIVEDASDVHTIDGGPSPFISQWHSNENEKGACYQPGNDCVFGGHYPDGETIIICNPDA